MPSFKSVRKAVKFVDAEGKEQVKYEQFYLPEDDISKVHPYKKGAPHPLIEGAINMGLVKITEEEIIKIQDEWQKKSDEDIAKRAR